MMRQEKNFKINWRPFFSYRYNRAAGDVSARSESFARTSFKFSTSFSLLLRHDYLPSEKGRKSKKHARTKYSDCALMWATPSALWITIFFYRIFILFCPPTVKMGARKKRARVTDKIGRKSDRLDRKGLYSKMWHLLYIIMVQIHFFLMDTSDFCSQSPCIVCCTPFYPTDRVSLKCYLLDRWHSD